MLTYHPARYSEKAPVHWMTQQYCAYFSECNADCLASIPVINFKERGEDRVWKFISTAATAATSIRGQILFLPKLRCGKAARMTYFQSLYLKRKKGHSLARPVNRGLKSVRRIEYWEIHLFYEATHNTSLFRFFYIRLLHAVMLVFGLFMPLNWHSQGSNSIQRVHYIHPENVELIFIGLLQFFFHAIASFSDDDDSL